MEFHLLIGDAGAPRSALCDQAIQDLAALRPRLHVEMGCDGDVDL